MTEPSARDAGTPTRGETTQTTRTTAVDGVVLTRVLGAYREVLRAHQEELNRLNVYPVPDGDTGTNLALTLESVHAALVGTTDLDAVCEAIAHGSLMGARGNSGVILSQILRGLTDAFRAGGAVGAPELVDGLHRASNAAYAAVMHPVEGTILTVVRSSADAAAAADPDDSLESVLTVVREAAHDAVARTPEQLPVLAEAGVVDAGGRGLALLFDAWLHVLDGRPLPEPERVAPAGVSTPASGIGEPGVLGQLGQPDARSRTDLGPRYEVMFLLAAPDAEIDGFRDAWDGLGESIVVVGGDGTWNCHVHTDDLAGAIEAGLAVGRPSGLHITDLWEQVGQREAEWVAAAGAVTSAVIAVATGPGITALMRDLGAASVVSGGQSMNPSTAEILDAVERVEATGIVILPNNRNIIPVAEQVVGLASRPVVIVPTRSVIEALAALLEHDPDAPAGDNAVVMAAAAARVRTGEVTQAVRDGVGECGPIAAGDWLAVTRAGISARAASALEAAIAVVDLLVTDDDELVTVLAGEGALPGDVERLRAHVGATHPSVELEVHDGGQPLYPYLLGVE